MSISEDVFKLSELGDGGVVMDTGTAVTRLPTVAYEAFRDGFIAQTTNLPRASGVSIFDTCYDLFGFVSVRVPTVSFYFSGGPILTLPARNFLIPVDDVGTFCFAFALFTLEEHYHNLLSARGCNGITVKQDGNSGKGFYFFIFNFNNSVICLCSIKLLNLYILHSNCFKSLIFIL